MILSHAIASYYKILHPVQEQWLNTWELKWVFRVNGKTKRCAHVLYNMTLSSIPECISRTKEENHKQLFSNCPHIQNDKPCEELELTAN